MNGKYPPWLLRPVDVLADDLLALGGMLTAAREDASGLHRQLERLRNDDRYREVVYDVVSRTLWDRIEDVRTTSNATTCVWFLRCCRIVMPERATVHVLRQFARHRDKRVRFEVQKLAVFASSSIATSSSLKFPAVPGSGSWCVQKKPSIFAAPPDVPKIPTVGELRRFFHVRTPKSLGFFLLACAARSVINLETQKPETQIGPYTLHTIPKRDGKPRQICAPCPELKVIQRRILDEIVSCVPTHDAAHGFAADRSILSNASPHVGKKIVVRFDLKDFFPTVSFHRVRGFFSSLGFPGEGTQISTKDDSTQVAQVLARLCCYADKVRDWGGGGLPQGSPASPMIANLVCRKLDSRLTGLSKKIGADYTRYADDLTFSFSESGAPVGKLKYWVDQITQEEGFLINHEKFRVCRAGHRQIVTGVVVNDVPRAPNETRKWLRAVIHNCKNHGVASQAEKFALTEGADVDFVSHIRGIASYLHMVSPGTAGDLLAETIEATTTTEGAN